jgi:hypothetical protein
MGATATAHDIVLHEQYTLSADRRVDKIAGMVRDCKILGRLSANSHEIPNAERSEYTVDAMKNGAHLYEGADVYRGHAKKDEVDLDPNGDRDPADKIGVIENVHYDPTGHEDGKDGLRGDLRLFNPAAEFSVTLLNAPLHFAMSHNAVGKWELRNNVAVVTEIRKVRSVDVVSRGGSTSNLLEHHKGPNMSVTVKSEITKFLPRQWKKGIARLLEMGGMSEAMMPTEATPESEGPGDYEDHLAKTAVAIFADEELTKEQKKQKIIALLKITEDDVAGAEDLEEDEEGDDDMEESEECDADGNPMPKKKMSETMKESLRLKSENAMMQRREQIRDLCESSKISLTREAIDDLARMRDVNAAKRLLTTLHESAVEAADPMRRPPKSRGHGRKDDDPKEGLPTAEDLVAALPG